MSTEESIAALVEAANGLTDVVDNKIQDIDQRADTAISLIANSYAQCIISYYDNTRHSQQTLSPPLEPEDNTKTQWVVLPTGKAGFHVYPSENKLTKVHSTYCQAHPPGHYEDPQYIIDYSRTFVQFVLANESATSSQINERLSETNQDIAMYGGWWDGAAVLDIPSVRIHGLHPYSRLFVRFINISMNDQPAQEVDKFGGNPSLSIDRVINYPNIQRG